MKHRGLGVVQSMNWHLKLNAGDIRELAQAEFDDVCTGGNPCAAKVKAISMLYMNAS